MNLRNWKRLRERDGKLIFDLGLYNSKFQNVLLQNVINETRHILELKHSFSVEAIKNQNYKERNPHGC